MVSVIWSNTPVADRNTTACLLFVCMIAASEFMAQHVDAACTCTYRLPLLQELYDATNGAAWVRPWNMAAVDAPCGFDGVTCGVSDITSIVLSSGGLNGTLPPSLGQLGGLVTLKVDSNFLDGSLPPEFQNWTSLQTIDVSDNNVSGTLPSEYCLWTQLTFFHASRNKLEGSMPASYSAWEKCDQFDVSHNQLTGTLPPVYGSWSVINVFTAGVNGFGGVLPSSYANWSRIGSFNVSMNSLTGTLPPGYASFVALGEFDVSYNNLFGTVPVQYAAWKSMSRFYLASNKLSGTISNSLFGAWLSANAFSVRRNALTGTIPSTLLALTTLQVAYLGLNMFTGVIPTTISSSLLILDLQNNTGLMGTLPSRSMFVTVCGTGVCPTTSLPPQYCLSVSAAESLSSTGTSDPVQMLTELAPYSSSCTPPDALHLTSAAPQAANADNVLRNVTVTYLDPTTRSIGLAVSFVSSVVGGSGGALRGAVPGLQRATTALRLTVLCSAGANASANDAMFSDRSDNALGLSVPVGSSGLEYAAGAPIGNAMLVFAVGACLHGVAVVRERLQLLTTLAQSALRVLPTSLLPGAFAVAYGTQMQPSVGASFALVVVSARTAQSVACGIALLVVWLAFPLYCVHRALVACRTEDGAFGLASIQAAKRRRERNGGRRHSNLRFARVQSLHEFWMTPCAEWVVPPKTTLSQSASAAFVLKHLEPVFGAYVGRREWYFVVEWSLVAVGGVVTGVAEAVATDGDACGAAEWATWCMIVIGTLQIASMVALRPLSVRFEMASSAIIGSLTTLSLVLALVGTIDAAEVIVNVAGILELVVMIMMLVDVSTLRIVAQSKNPATGDKRQAICSTGGSVVETVAKRHCTMELKTVECLRKTTIEDVDVIQKLHELIALVCARPRRSALEL